MRDVCTDRPLREPCRADKTALGVTVNLDKSENLLTLRWCRGEESNLS